MLIARLTPRFLYVFTVSSPLQYKLHEGRTHLPSCIGRKSEKRHRSTGRAVIAALITTGLPAEAPPPLISKETQDKLLLTKTFYFQLLWTGLHPSQTHMLSLSLRRWHTKMSALGDNLVYKRGGDSRTHSRLRGHRTSCLVPLRARKRAFPAPGPPDSWPPEL